VVDVVAVEQPIAGVVGHEVEDDLSHVRRESGLCPLGGTVVRSEFKFRRLPLVDDCLVAGVDGDDRLVVRGLLRSVLSQPLDERFAVEFVAA